jgi:hypothetical protein
LEGLAAGCQDHVGSLADIQQRVLLLLLMLLLLLLLLFFPCVFGRRVFFPCVF